MAREVSLRMVFGDEIRDERDVAEIFAEMGMNCDGVVKVTCQVGQARVTQSDLTEEFWEKRCTRSDLHLYDTDEP